MIVPDSAIYSNGYPKLIRWENCRGIQKNGIIVIAEHYIDPSVSHEKQLCLSQNPNHLLAHEVGHLEAKDNLTGWPISATEGFEEAFRQDLKTLNRAQRQSLAQGLLVTPTNLHRLSYRSCSEVFAECRAFQRMGKSPRNTVIPLLKSTLRYIDEQCAL